MRSSVNESPINPLPPVIWLLIAPLVISEIAFGLAQTGLIGGAQGIGLRQTVLERTAFAPEFILRAVMTGDWGNAQLWRLLTYPFIHISPMQAVFVAVFTLALGKMVAEQFRPAAVLALFFGSAIGGALIYTAVNVLIGVRFGPLMGGFPAVYGLVGAFTFLLWLRLGYENANQFRAFTLIGVLLTFQLVFGIIFGGAGYGWIAEVAGFAVGFLLSFVLIPGGLARTLRHIRDRA